MISPSINLFYSYSHLFCVLGSTCVRSCSRVCFLLAKLHQQLEKEIVVPAMVVLATLQNQQRESIKNNSLSRELNVTQLKRHGVMRCDFLQTNFKIYFIMMYNKTRKFLSFDSKALYKQPKH